MCEGLWNNEKSCEFFCTVIVKSKKFIAPNIMAKNIQLTTNNKCPAAKTEIELGRKKIFERDSQ